MASISSRTTRSTLRKTRKPSGSQVNPPGAARRMYPPRTSSRWLGTSASAGSSRRVRRNKVDMRSTTDLQVVEASAYRRGTSGFSGWNRHLTAAFELVPRQVRPRDRADHRLDDDEVDQLPVE